MVVASIMGDGGAGGLEGASTFFRSRQPTSTLFHDSPYIRALNRILVQERTATHTYQRVALSHLGSMTMVSVQDSHRYAAREVVRLITLNSGLPDDISSTALSPPVVLLRLFTAMTSNLGYRATMQTLDLMEKRIFRHYSRALRLAPDSDRPILMDLQKKTNEHRQSLRDTPHRTR